MNFSEAIFSELTSQRPEFANAMDEWQSKLSPALEAKEEERKAIIKKARGRTVNVGLAIGFVAIVTMIATGGAALPFVLFIGVFALILGSGVAWVPLFTMKSETKQMVVGAAAEAFGFTYDTLHPDVSGISDWRSAGTWIKANQNQFTKRKDEPPTPAYDVLDKAGFMPGYDNRKFEDQITGERAGASFSLVECKLTQEQGSGKNRRTVTTFQGLLFHIAYPERFLARTLIARQGWWKGWRGGKGLEKVDMVSKELEDSFTIYSTDQVEARFLFTPDRMERLIALERHFKGGKLRGVFEGDHLTLALEADDQFEAGSIWKTLVDPDRFVSALTEMGLVCDLIDGFLTREWVKDKL